MTNALITISVPVKGELRSSFAPLQGLRLKILRYDGTTWQAEPRTSQRGRVACRPHNRTASIMNGLGQHYMHANCKVGSKPRGTLWTGRAIATPRLAWPHVSFNSHLPGVSASLISNALPYIIRRLRSLHSFVAHHSRPSKHSSARSITQRRVIPAVAVSKVV